MYAQGIGLALAVRLSAPPETLLPWCDAVSAKNF